MEFENKTDAELVSIATQGDIKALDFLLLKYSKSIYNFIFYLTRDKENTNDIFQDTFIKIFRHLKKFKPEYSFKTWAISIARNTAIDLFRKKHATSFSSLTKEDSEVSFEETLEDTEPLPDEIFERNETKEQVEKLLEILSLDQKTIVILHNNEQMTFEEIGEVLKKPTNTVKSQYRRALIKLRKHI